MLYRIGSVAVISVAMFSGSLRAKPPEVPAVPRADCEVPPLLVQEFFLSEGIDTTSESLNKPSGFNVIWRKLPVCHLFSEGVVDSVADLLIAVNPLHNYPRTLLEQTDSMAFQPVTPLENLEKLKKAAREFKLAEARREAGLMDAAVAGYERILKLVPGSRYAQMAAERLGRTRANPPSEEPK
jgi:hypothetical protein